MRALIPRRSSVLVLMLLAALAYYFNPLPLTPPMAGHLPADTNEARQAFKARVKAAFPVGSSEAHLIEILAAQGFTMKEHEASFAKEHSLCMKEWRIQWKTDDDENIKSITSSYGLTCP